MTSAPEPAPAEVEPAPEHLISRRQWLTRYIAIRLLILIPLAVLVTVVAFSLTQVAPGGPVSAIIGERPTTPETVAALKEKYHLNDPVVAQYWRWAKGVLTGDWGASIITHEPVLGEIWQRAQVTLVITSAGIFIALLLGIVTGVLAALRRGRLLDRVLSSISILFLSTPTFALALGLLYLLGFRFGWFPIFGSGEWLGSRLHHLALPALVLGLHGMGFVMRLTRASMLEQFDEDYVAFARARGLSERKVIGGYAFRNALIPILTAGGLLFLGLLTGSVLVETVFGLPGLGNMLVTAVKGSDFPVIQGLILIIAAWIILVNIVVDILYAVVDPRVGFEKALG